jgi:hypothetical protein
MTDRWLTLVVVLSSMTEDGFSFSSHRPACQIGDWNFTTLVQRAGMQFWMCMDLVQRARS